MAVKSTGTTPTETKPPAEAPTPAAEPPTEPAPASGAEPGPARVESDCVVESDFHVGRVVNGKVCSYHAMHYDAEGNRRK